MTLKDIEAQIAKDLESLADTAIYHILNTEDESVRNTHIFALSKKIDAAYKYMSGDKIKAVLKEANDVARAKYQKS